MNWIRAMRPITVLKAGLLTLISFQLSNGKLSGNAFILAIFVTLGAMATMVLNDWEDRRHDRKKGKDFAYRKGYRFLAFAITLWAIALMLGVYIWVTRQEYGLISIVLMLIGVVYSKTRYVLLLPTLTVALASALPVLYPLAEAPNLKIYALFLVVFLFIFGREILKDLGDTHDVGYKNTLPVRFGEVISKRVAGVLFALTLFVLPMISLFATGIALLPVGLASALLLTNRNHKTPKAIMDGTTLVVLVSLVI